MVLEEVRDRTVDPSMTVEELVQLYRDIHGFMAGHLAEAADILVSCMDADLRVLSFTANLVATGLRGVIAQSIREGLFNLVVTTCGTIDHDIARSTGGRYLKGSFQLDDEELRDRGLHRLGNIVIPVDDYGPRVERLTYSVLDQLPRDREWSIYEILWEIGRRLKDPYSILRAAYERKVPVIVPGFLDGAFGTALYTYLQTHRDLKLNVFGDEDVIAHAFFTARKALALVLGGGISKHHTIWWAQVREGLDCAVYVTTAVEYDGSLSGAQTREAISWGKIRKKAKHVVVYADATLVLPLLVASMLARKRSKS
jgi:deoxyhypusine synthase